MEIKYFNSNFDNITQNKDTDQSITNVIEKLPSLNIVSDKNLLEETIKISNQFKEKKEKIIVFGTGGSNLGARALNNVISNNKIILEFYDNVDPINFEKNFQNINFELTGFLVVSKSGTTPETLSQFSCLYQKAIEANKVDAFFSNTLIITEFKESPLFLNCKR
jgi:Glucose-6-phosphate isomerase